MEAAANQGSAALPHVNPNATNRLSWTVDGLRVLLRHVDAGDPTTARPARRALRDLGLSVEDARERAYGPVAPRPIFSLAEVAARAADYDCLHMAPVLDDPGLDCRSAVPTDPDSWCPTCVAREATGK